MEPKVCSADMSAKGFEKRKNSDNNLALSISIFAAVCIFAAGYYFCGNLCYINRFSPLRPWEMIAWNEEARLIAEMSAVLIAAVGAALVLYCSVSRLLEYFRTEENDILRKAKSAEGKYEKDNHLVVLISVFTTVFFVVVGFNMAYYYTSGYLFYYRTATATGSLPVPAYAVLAIGGCAAVAIAVFAFFTAKYTAARFLEHFRIKENEIAEKEIQSNETENLDISD